MKFETHKDLLSKPLTLPPGITLDSGATKYIPVQGTWAWRDREFAQIAAVLTRSPMAVGRMLAAKDPPAWWQQGSDIVRYLGAHDLILLDADDPFTWTTSVNGLPAFLQKLRQGSVATDHRDWQAGGLALKWYMKNVAFDDRNVIAHSHGLQVVLYAMAYGVEFRNILSVGSPIRSDMLDAMEFASSKKRFSFWSHVYDPTGDKTQAQGTWFDGDELDHKWPNFPRGACPYASQSIGLAGVRHSNILYSPQWFDVWSSSNLFNALRYRIAQQEK